MMPALNLELSPSGPIRPGSTIQINLTLKTSGTSIASLQETFHLTTGGTFRIVNGPANLEGGKQSSCGVVGSDIRCVDAGMNQTAYRDGIVKTLWISIPSDAPTGIASIRLSNVAGATPEGERVVIGSEVGAINFRIGK